MQNRLKALREIHPQLETARDLTLRPRRESACKSQVEALDSLLGGGFEAGELVELVGRRSCGRFSTLLRTLATFTQRGDTAALVDLGDGLDPRVAVAAGIDLSRLLWARPKYLKKALIATELLLNTGFPLVVLDLGSPPVPGGRGSEASWIRLARTAQKRRSILLVSSPYRASGTTAQTIIESGHARARWKGSGRTPKLLDALHIELRLTKAIRARPHSSQRARMALPSRLAMSRRLACLFLPLFPLAARLRSEPELAGEALVVLVGNGTAARVAAASRRARRAGVRCGMSLAQARALLPNVAARGRDEVCEHAAQQCLLEIAEALSPRIEDAGHGIIYLDINGLERHWPEERDLGLALARATERAGLPARVGIAGSKLAARVAAEQPDSPTLVPAGSEASFLAPLPLSRLLTEARILERLERWGIQSIGQFAELPKNEITSRFGDSGQRLHRQARGFDSHPLIPHTPPATFDEGMDLEWPLTTLEPFLFVARAALERLCDRMRRRGLACLRLETSLHLEPDGVHERSVELPTPTRDIKTLLTLVRLDLEANPPGAPVLGFTLRGHPDRPREAQLTLFGPTTLSPDRLATTLARLFTLLGPDGVGTPQPSDDHRPESLHLLPFTPSPPPDEIRESEPQGYGLLAVRALRPPIPIEVIVDSRPRRVSTPAGEGNERRPRIEGAVRVASGPWSLEEGWWNEQAVDRHYWDVELSDGGIYRIYCDHQSRNWFADGIYD